MLDFDKFCRKYRIEYLEQGHHHCHEGWIQTHCPFCSDGKDGYHLGFNIAKGNLNCWRCGSHSIWDFISTILNIKDKHTLGKIVAQFQKEGFRQRAPKDKRTGKVVAPKGIHELQDIHKRYLISRKFDPDKLVEDWHIQATSCYSEIWNWRIIIPIFNSLGGIVAYQGRAVYKNTRPKYQTSKKDEMACDPKMVIYGIHNIPGDSIIIVEGVPSVWRLGPGTVATLGIDWKEEQANIFRQFSNRYIMFDPEDQAQKRAKKLAEWLSYFKGTTEVISGLPCDPGDLDQAEADKIRKELGL